SEASSSVSPITLKTRFCTSSRWIRIDPPPISLPLQTMSYAYASADPGSGSNVASDSGFGDVKAWCTAVHAPGPTATSPSTAALLGPLLPRGQLLARLLGAPRHPDRTDVRRLEHPERRDLQVLRALDHLQTHPQARLVVADPRHHLALRHPRDRRLDAVA